VCNVDDKAGQQPSNRHLEPLHLHFWLLHCLPALDPLLLIAEKEMWVTVMLRHALRLFMPA